jgi:hypothetical protein
MIDPTNVTNFDRTDAELEEWWIFSTIVAGKTASTQAKLLDKFFAEARGELKGMIVPPNNPFGIIRNLEPYCLECSLNSNSCRCELDYDSVCDPLHDLMSLAHIGQYKRLLRCWRESLNLDLRNDPVEAFEAIHGVGPKTARMFLMHSRPNQRFAALDTHILKYLGVNGFDVPKTTPSGKQYYFLEDAFLALADAAGESPADFDLKIWKSYAR